MSWADTDQLLPQVPSLRQRLEKLCDDSEALAKGEDGEQLKALVFTKHIRKILQECS